MLYDSTRNMLHDPEKGISYNLVSNSTTLLPTHPEGIPVVVVSLLRTSFAPSFYDIRIDNHSALMKSTVSYPALVSILSESCLHYQKVSVATLSLKGTQFLYLLPTDFPISAYLTQL